VFGDALLTAPLDKSESDLPSPERLKRRIILKHKKLPPEGTRSLDEETSKIAVTVANDAANDNVHGMDIAHSVASGILYLQDLGEFSSHSCVSSQYPLNHLTNLVLGILHVDFCAMSAILVSAHKVLKAH
jgi:hypothetical protein